MLCALDISPTLPILLPSLQKHAHTLHARNAQDLGTAIRGIAVGYLGDNALLERKSGRTGIDEIEKWWSKLKDRMSSKELRLRKLTPDPGPPLLLHIEQAQMIPNHVLAELTYILTYRPYLILPDAC